MKELRDAIEREIADMRTTLLSVALKIREEDPEDRTTLGLAQVLVRLNEINSLVDDLEEMVD